MNAGADGCTPPVEIAIAVVEYGGRYLIGLRPSGVPLAGYWEFPGGKVQPGESPRDAAARECQEETGLAVDVGFEYPEVVHGYEHARVRLHFFHCTPHEPEAIIPARFRWVSGSQLAQFEFPPANAQLLSRLVETSAR